MVAKRASGRVLSLPLTPGNLENTFLRHIGFVMMLFCVGYLSETPAPVPFLLPLGLLFGYLARSEEGVVLRPFCGSDMLLNKQQPGVLMRCGG